MLIGITGTGTGNETNTTKSELSNVLHSNDENAPSGRSDPCSDLREGKLEVRKQGIKIWVSETTPRSPPPHHSPSLTGTGPTWIVYCFIRNRFCYFLPLFCFLLFSLLSSLKSDYWERSSLLLCNVHRLLCFFFFFFFYGSFTSFFLMRLDIRI